MEYVDVQKLWLFALAALTRVLEGGSLKRSLMLTSPVLLFPAIKKVEV